MPLHCELTIFHSLGGAAEDFEIFLWGNRRADGTPPCLAEHMPEAVSPQLSAEVEVIGAGYMTSREGIVDDVLSCAS